MKATVTVGSITTSDWMPINWKQHPIQVGLFAVVSAGGTLTYKVEVTHDDIFDPDVTPVASDHATMTSGSVSTIGVQETPITAVRLNVTAYTDGDVSLTAMQA